MDLIVVATDFSDAAAQALRYASAIAERDGARLLVMYADEFVPPLDEASLATGIAGAGCACEE
jgi:nucleotide-binding universal stress UspA family protein